MAEALVIGGSTINRTASAVTLLECQVFQKDSWPTFSFRIDGITLASLPDPYLGKSISYTLPDGTLLFVGDVQSVNHRWEPSAGWVAEYHCTGLRKRGDYIPVTDEVSKTDTIRFNVAPDDPSRILARQGRSIGQMVADVLEMATNRAALVAAGIGNFSSAGTGAAAHCVMSGRTISSVVVDSAGSGYTATPTLILLGGNGSGGVLTPTMSGGGLSSVAVSSAGTYDGTPTILISTLPADTLSDLDTLTIIPPSEVAFVGERLLGAIESTVQTWHPNHWLHVLPDGTIRLYDSRSFTASTLTFGYGTYVGLPTITRDVSQCFQRVVVRGATKVQSTLLQTLPYTGSSDTDGGLQEDFGHDGLDNATAKADYDATTDFVQPGIGQGYIEGTCTMPSTTTVRFTPTDSTLTWVANRWDQTDAGAKGWVNLRSDITTGVSQYQLARVVANTALTAGSYSDLTLDAAVASTNYTGCQLYGTGDGANEVWRKYKVTDATIGAALLQFFPYPVPYRSSIGSAPAAAGTLRSTPIGGVEWHGTSTPDELTIDPTTGHVYFQYPTGLVYSPDKKTVVTPDNVTAFVAYAIGTYTATYPADSGGSPVYGGTSYTKEGLERTKYITVNDWRDGSNQANMDLFAQETHGALSDAVVEGSIQIYELNTTYLTPGLKLNIQSSDGNTPWDDVAAPLIAVGLHFGEATLAGPSYLMDLRVSSRRAPYSGAIFMRPSQTGLTAFTTMNPSISIPTPTLPGGIPGMGGPSFDAGGFGDYPGLFGGIDTAAPPPATPPRSYGTPPMGPGPTVEDFAAAGIDTTGWGIPTDADLGIAPEPAADDSLGNLSE